MLSLIPEIPQLEHSIQYQRNYAWWCTVIIDWECVLVYF